MFAPTNTVSVSLKAEGNRLECFTLEDTKRLKKLNFLCQNKLVYLSPTNTVSDKKISLPLMAGQRMIEYCQRQAFPSFCQLTLRQFSFGYLQFAFLSMDLLLFSLLAFI